VKGTNTQLTGQANGAVTARLVLKRTGVVSGNYPDLALATDGTISGGEQLAGISVEAAADNALFGYVAAGVTEGVCGVAGIAAGVQYVTTDAAGKLKAAAAGDVIVGEYLSGRAASENDVVLVNVNLSNWAVA